MEPIRCLNSSRIGQNKTNIIHIFESGSKCTKPQANDGDSFCLSLLLPTNDPAFLCFCLLLILLPCVPVSSFVALRCPRLTQGLLSMQVCCCSTSLPSGGGDLTWTCLLPIQTVAKGHSPGVYDNWADAEQQVKVCFSPFRLPLHRKAISILTVCQRASMEPNLKNSKQKKKPRTL